MVFVDIDTIDVSKIEEKIRVRTKSIIPVHLYVQSVNVSEIMYIKEKYNLKVIEGCAQAHSAK